jgi:site-specific DNA-methyltransferase (adenine-specific)
VKLPNCYRCGNQPCTCSDGCTIYHADCREVLPLLEPGSVDLVLTDPPWIARKDQITRPRSKGVANVVEPSRGIGYGNIGQFNTAVLESAFSITAHDMLVICGYKELGNVIAVMKPIRGCFIWHKPNGGISVAYPSPLDVAYIVWGAHKSKLTGYQHWKSGVFSIPVPTAGCVSNGERFLERPRGKALHPAQGPLRLYRELLKPGEGLVLDPYIGTGTTLRACKDLGRKGIGIEIEEKYCEIAAQRLEQGVLF